MEKSSCGVGFMASLIQKSSHENLLIAIGALCNMEHRGGTGSDPLFGDGAGIMTAIPWEIIGKKYIGNAVANLFLPTDSELKNRSLKVFEECFSQYGLDILLYRDVPIDTKVLSSYAIDLMPAMTQVIIKRPKHCRTNSSFEKLLYLAKQLTRIKQKENNIIKKFYFTSLSSSGIVYKALCTSSQLQKFYLDLTDKKFKTNFALIHRRFSTNTLSSWDKVQPFRLIAHNGEINTIEGNRTQAISREKALGLREDELITRAGVSDSGNLNGMVEALKYRSAIPFTSEILSIMIPPASDDSYYKFWSRAMEPWDGPALVTFCDGKYIGARLDRSGFRPCRWSETNENFYLASETGVFRHGEDVLSHGAISAGKGVSIHLFKKSISFEDSSQNYKKDDFIFSANLKKINYCDVNNEINFQNKRFLYSYSSEDFSKILKPMVIEEKESVGSMGYTATPAYLSTNPRSIFDYFFQDFAQVTNPPLDYIREKMVTDMTVYLCRKPNIFEPKDLLPPKYGFELEGPILSLGQLEKIKTLNDRIKTVEISTTFSKKLKTFDISNKIKEITKLAILEVKNGATIILLSDRSSNEENYPLPSLLVLRSIHLGLNRVGLRLKVSIIIDSGEIKDSHQISALLSFGASAVCPFVILDYARNLEDEKLKNFFPFEKEQRLINALKNGIMKIMAKMGISVLRSYQGSQLFTILGLEKELIASYFPQSLSLIGGASFDDIINSRIKEINFHKDNGNKLRNLFEYNEHPKEKKGENHSISTLRSRIIHKMVLLNYPNKVGTKLFKDFNYFLKMNVVNISSLLDLKKNKDVDDNQKQCVESVDTIIQTFGLGAMSFGAISSFSQRDLIKAFNLLNARSNSGEGGENPYYFIDGTTSSTKQIASGRFGVTAEYLMNSKEIQIKIVQGAKPGEGGQLLAKKVSKEIARSRFSTAGIDLISPAPQHDIYSIEDLKQLIYELKQLHPSCFVSVKLVSGKNIGAIAVGVAKAGANIIQISGGDGGTGAATISSMKHAGLPLAFGLFEVHQTLVKNKLRKNVILRVDGGLQVGKDIVLAAILGAEQFDFGKIVLISQGCIMARVCHKNTCPTGIATQDSKLKGRYAGEVSHIVNYLKYLGEDVQTILKTMGLKSLKDAIGRTDLLQENKQHEQFLKIKNINLAYFFKKSKNLYFNNKNDKFVRNSLNEKIVTDVENLLKKGSDDYSFEYDIVSTDRAILSSVSSMIAKKIIKDRKDNKYEFEKYPFGKKLSFKFHGTAGQGFGVFHNLGMETILYGASNDSFGKGMNGGALAITPPKNINNNIKSLDPTTNSIIGNCAFYGATGGEAFINGIAGDRFAIRNSGADITVMGVGLHACEYMTNGSVLLIDSALENIGAGMTGGILYCYSNNIEKFSQLINFQYLKMIPLSIENILFINGQLWKFLNYTDNEKVKNILDDWKIEKNNFFKFVPI